MNIYYDQDGNRYDPCEEKNEAVKEALYPILQEFLAEKQMILAMKKQPKLGGRFMKMLVLELIKSPPMSVDDFVDLDFETINHYYIKFSELIAHYNRYFEIVENKNIFMRYLSIDPDQYNRLENHEDERIQRVMRMIDNDYIGMGWSSIENGEVDSKGTTARLKASGTAGHSVTSAVEDKMIKAVEAPSSYVLEQQVESILGGNKKLLNGK